MKRVFALIVLLIAGGVAFGYAQSEPYENKLPLLINVPADYSSIRDALANNQRQPIRIEVDAREGPFFEADMVVNWDGVNGVSIMSIHGRAEIRPRQTGERIAIRSDGPTNGESLGQTVTYRENGITIEGFDFVASKHDDWLTVNCDSCTFRYNRFIGINVFFAGKNVFLFNNEFVASTSDFVYLYPDPVVAVCLDEQSQVRSNNFIQRDLILLEYPACDYDVTD